MRRLSSISLSFILVLWVTAFWAVAAKQVPALTGNFHQTQVAGYLRFPWAFVEKPLGGWLITERGGRLVEYSHTGLRQEIELNIDNLYFAGQGGLLDIVLAKDFIDSRRVYLSYSIGNEEENYLAFGTAVLLGQSANVTTLFKLPTAKDTAVHFGGRLLRRDDGSWLLTTGDGFEYRTSAQQKYNALGKVLRFTTDGQPAKDNPYVSSDDLVTKYVYTYGHRNPQGLVYDKDTGVIWQHEHGPAGGDEINQLLPGHNYGWPVVTLGNDYSGAKISPFTHYQGMDDPWLNWTPSIAPSSMTIYKNDVFPLLKDYLLITSLKDKALYAVASTQSEPASIKIFDTITERLRDVLVGRDGAIYVLTDGKHGRVMRFAPLHPKNVPEHSMR